jgi:hypothetical protein
MSDAAVPDPATVEPRRISAHDSEVHPAADIEPPLEALTPAERNEVSENPADPGFPWHADPLAASGPPAAGSSPRLPAETPTLADPTAPRAAWKRDLPPPPGSPGAPAVSTSSGAAQWDTRNNRAPSGQLASDAPPADRTIGHGDRATAAHATQKLTTAGKTTSGNRLATARDKIEHEIEADEAAFNAKTAGWHWFPLTITLLLFVSVGANLYLAWIAWDARTRCRSLVERFHAGELTAS